MIPRILWQVWVGDAPVPPQYAEWRERWRALHPEWEHVLVGDANRPRPLRNEDLYEQAETIVPGFEGQFRADLLRYELLASDGGVYADLDTEPLWPLDGILDCEAFVGWEIQDRWANNAVMGATAGHAFVRHLVAGIPESVYRDRQPGARPSVLTGPRYLTPVLRQHADTVRVFDQPVFYPYGYLDVGTPRERGPWPPETLVAHHWNNQRRLRAARSARGPQTFTSPRRLR